MQNRHPERSDSGGFFMVLGLARRFALRINGEDRPGSIERSHLEALARSMRFQPRYVLRQGLELAERMPAAIDATLATLSPEAHQGSEPTLLERLQRRLLSNCRKLPLRWAVGGRLVGHGSRQGSTYTSR